MEQDDMNIMVTTKVTSTYDIRINRDIDTPEHFTKELVAIEQAQQEDEINLHLCTDGGSVHTALLLRKALVKSPAKTKAFIGPNCCSAGSLLALSCDEWEIDEWSTMMVHSATFGVFGKHHELKGQFEFKDRYLTRMIQSIYAGFLSESEIQQVLDGKDFWFEADELSERLTYFAEYRKALYEAGMLDTTQPEE